LPVFSLAKLCAPIFTPSNLKSGCVTLIAVDVVAVEEAIQADLRPEMRKILQRCIHPDQALLLPAMSDTEPVESFFIVACADSERPVIETSIRRELQSFDRTSKLKPVISSTMLQVLPDPSREQLEKVAVHMEHWIHAHLLDKEKPR